MILGTLGRYFARRFFATIMTVFAAVFALIYAIDVVETLRRAGDTPGATAPLMGWLSFLHTPIVAEQALPFAVLFGAMISFLDLSRRLELVVARSAGVSVWQFITPPVLIAVAIGIAVTGLYNPVSTSMKRQADRIEAKLFGSGASPSASVWIRQKSVDGESVLHADGRGEAQNALIGVQVFSFEPNGAFAERIDADHAVLEDGYWRLTDAKVVTPGFDTLATSVYLLATTMTQADISQAFSAPETVSFWALPELVEETRRAGLDPTAYSLQYQELLALPALLAAMVLVAACFSLRFFRTGGVQRMVSGGVLAGFVLYVATKLVNDLGGVGFFSATVAGWSPAVVGCLFGVYVLLLQEDG
ncbi:MAG: LPS export ABC transporter permease LptG [Bradyrhizobium sp.]|nr:MAG: LPS export ABC transporter permease LptG [Bradyrhizobium sp.]